MEKVTPSVSKDGDNVVITLAPDGGLPVGSHTVEVYERSNGSASRFRLVSLCRRSTSAKAMFRLKLRAV